MASRHPTGGGTLRVCKQMLALGLLGLLGACVVGSLTLLGCGGDTHDDHHYYPRYHEVTIILNVSDASGHALGQAVVWVDGIAQPEQTSWEFVTLGNDFPPSWRGFAANWIKGGFTVVTYGYDDVAEINVTVSKPGFYAQTTTFHVDDAQPEEVFARDTFIMEPMPFPATAGIEQARKKDKPGEVIGWSKKAQTSRAPSMYKIAQGAVLASFRRLAGV